MSTKVNVYENNPWEGYHFDGGQIIARVKYNQRLDMWNGSNWQNGGTGMHKGITKLRKPIDPKRPYVIIIGSQWQGSRDYAYCVSAKEAAQEVLSADSHEQDWMWPDLKEICAAMDAEEVEV